MVNNDPKNDKKNDPKNDKKNEPQPLQSMYTSGSIFGPLLPFGRKAAITKDVNLRSDNGSGLDIGIGLPVYHTPDDNLLLCNEIHEQTAMRTAMRSKEAEGD